MSIIDVLHSKDLVEYIPGLERQSDGTYRKTCEFHDHATNPTSFAVFPHDNTAYCFSCGIHVDIIKYVMLRDGVSYGQAIETLCDDYGIDSGTDEIYKQQKSIAEKNEQWCQSYEKHLDKCYDYLTKKRGLTDEMIKLYRLGWSDRSKAVTIPMLNQYHQVVSFGYRYFDKMPKYKNGKNNELFTKGSYLFNIDKIPKLLRKNKRLYVVEGFFDSISCQQQGEASVAYCGISFSKDHVLLIKEYTQHINGVQIILVPDNDNKANKFVSRGREMFETWYPNANVKVAVIQ